MAEGNEHVSLKAHRGLQVISAIGKLFHNQRKTYISLYFDQSLSV